MSYIITVHSRQHYGEVGNRHICKMDWQKVLNTILKYLWDCEVPINQRLPTSHFNSRLQQQRKIPSCTNRGREPLYVFIVLQDVLGVDPNFFFRVKIWNLLQKGMSRSHRQRVNVFERW